MTPGRQLYVYWRVAASDAAAACAATQSIQAALQASIPGLAAWLLQRCEDAPANDELTLMEVYRHPAGVSAALQSQIAQAALPLMRWCRGQRHVEVFQPLAPASQT